MKHEVISTVTKLYDKTKGAHSNNIRRDGSSMAAAFGLSFATFQLEDDTVIDLKIDEKQQDSLRIGMKGKLIHDDVTVLSFTSLDRKDVKVRSKLRFLWIPVALILAVLLIAIIPIRHEINETVRIPVCKLGELPLSMSGGTIDFPDAETETVTISGTRSAHLILFEDRYTLTVTLENGKQYRCNAAKADLVYYGNFRLSLPGTSGTAAVSHLYFDRSIENPIYFWMP